jgi:hypothetical protein
VCTRVGNQRSHGVVIATLWSSIQSLPHQHRDLHQSTYLNIAEDREPTSHRLCHLQRCRRPLGPTTIAVDLLPGRAAVGSPSQWDSIFPNPPHHRWQQEPAGPPPVLCCLTVGVQYAYQTTLLWKGSHRIRSMVFFFCVKMGYKEIGSMKHKNKFCFNGGHEGVKKQLPFNGCTFDKVWQCVDRFRHFKSWWFSFI